jgi:hypothetical protein
MLENGDFYQTRGGAEMVNGSAHLTQLENGQTWQVLRLLTLKSRLHQRKGNPKA